MPLIRKDPAPAAPPPSSAEVIERLRAGTDDERFAAARSLSDRPDAVPALGAALVAEAAPRVREAILTSLARLGGADSVAAVAPLIRSDDAGVRTGALDALRLMPDAVAAALPQLLSDTEADTRLLACELARHLPPALGSRMLCDLLTEETEPNVCAAALDVLVEIGGLDALPTLSLCQARFADIPFLVFAIRVAQDRLGAKTTGPRG